MNIGFVSNSLSLRGTDINLYNYANYNEKILGNKSIIITRPYEYIKKYEPKNDDITPQAYKKFSDRFEIEYYYSPIDIEDIVRRYNIDVLFIEKFGLKSDGLVFDCCKTIIHAVFSTAEPHGDLYCPISDTVNRLHGTNFPVLPNMIDVYDTNDNLRSELNIPKDAIVFGSYSGAAEYNIDFIKQAVSNIVVNPQYNNIYFIYLNINKFGPESPNIKFLPGTADMCYKRKFINTCDAMLYGRKSGETFGLACGEFSVCNKPIIGCSGCHDDAHERILEDNLIKIKNYDDVIDIITNWSKYNKNVSNNNYKCYNPKNVMNLFKVQLDKLFGTNTTKYNIEDNLIIFCTAYKDIRREQWKHYSRNNETYIDYFVKLASNITYKLIVYVENDILLQLSKYNFKSNIIFLSYDDVTTFYDEYIENEKRMIDSSEYIQKCRSDRRIKNPENWCAEYNLTTHNKINFVNHTKKLFPNYEYYSWIDFGCIRNRIDDIPKNIDTTKLHNKIHFAVLIKPPNEKISSDIILKTDDVYFDGSRFIVHNSLVQIFESHYRDLLEIWKKEIICDDDQSAVLQIYFDNKDLFQLYEDNEWFSLFRKHLNT